MGLDMYLYRASKSQRISLDRIGKRWNRLEEKYGKTIEKFPRKTNEYGVTWEFDNKAFSPEQKKVWGSYLRTYNKIRKDEKTIEGEIKSFNSSTNFTDHTYGYHIMYWRKFNALHAYIVDNFANGVDECQDIHLGIADLKKILKDLRKTKSILSKCKKIHKKKFADGYFIYRVPKNCDFPVKPRSGFFFGSTEYDKWFADDLKDSIKWFNDLLKTTTADDYVWYSASW